MNTEIQRLVTLMDKANRVGMIDHYADERLQLLLLSNDPLLKHIINIPVIVNITPCKTLD